SAAPLSSIPFTFRHAPSGSPLRWLASRLPPARRRPGRTPIDVQAILPFMAYMLFSVIVLLILWFWYAAYRHRYYWAHTSFAGARFRSTVFAGRLIWLMFTNQLLFGVTLGLALPWLLTRNLRFLFANVSLEGPLDLAAIQQDVQAASAAGGALGDALDIGFLDVDLAI